jgi:hypothetical protein
MVHLQATRVETEMMAEQSKSGAIWRAELMKRLDAALLNSGVVPRGEERTVGALRATASYCRERAATLDPAMARELGDVAAQLEAEALSKESSVHAGIHSLRPRLFGQD